MWISVVISVWKFDKFWLQLFCNARHSPLFWVFSCFALPFLCWVTYNWFPGVHSFWEVRNRTCFKPGRETRHLKHLQNHGEQDRWTQCCGFFCCNFVSCFCEPVSHQVLLIDHNRNMAHNEGYQMSYRMVDYLEQLLDHANFKSKIVTKIITEIYSLFYFCSDGTADLSEAYRMRYLVTISD